jgi:hypothetical protein
MIPSCMYTSLTTSATGTAPHQESLPAEGHCMDVGAHAAINTAQQAATNRVYEHWPIPFLLGTLSVSLRGRRAMACPGTTPISHDSITDTGQPGISPLSQPLGVPPAHTRMGRRQGAGTRQLTVSAGRSFHASVLFVRPYTSTSRAQKQHTSRVPASATTTTTFCASRRAAYRIEPSLSCC